MKTGEKIRVLRRGRGWTQSELAKRLGYSKQYVSAIEKGDKDCYPLLRKMAEAFGLNCEELLDD